MSCTKCIVSGKKSHHVELRLKRVVRHTILPLRQHGQTMQTSHWLHRGGCGQASGHIGGGCMQMDKAGPTGIAPART